MNILTKEIKAQIRFIAEQRLADGKAYIVIPKQDIDDYSKILEESYKNGEFNLEEVQ